MVLVAVFGGELVLVEQVGELLLDRFSGRVLDPAEILLVGVPLPDLEPVSVAA